jgi:hypothetical protein
VCGVPEILGVLLVVVLEELLAELEPSDDVLLLVPLARGVENGPGESSEPQAVSADARSEPNTARHTQRRNPETSQVMFCAAPSMSENPCKGQTQLTASA